MGVGIAVLDRLPVPARTDTNVDALLAAVAAARDAALVLTPECFLTGYDLAREEAHAAALAPDAPAWKAIADAARRHRTFVAAGAVTRCGDHLHNTLRVLGPDGTDVAYDKVHLPPLGLDPFVEPGHDGFERLVATPFGPVGLSICYDIRFPEAIRTLALRGARIVLVPACYPAASIRVPTFFPTVRAMENGVIVAMAAGGGHSRGADYVTGSQIVDPTGTSVAAPRPGSSLLVAEVEPEDAGLDGGSADLPGYRLDFGADRRPDLYSC